MIVIDKLCYSSKLRYVNPYEKFFFAMLTLIFCIVNRSFAIDIFVLILNAYLTVYKGGVKAHRYFKLMTVPLVFLVLSTVAIIVNISKEPLDAFAIPLGSIYLTGSTVGIIKGISLILTALAAVSCLYFLSLSTTMTDVLMVLESMKVPSIVIELMLLIYRFIFIMMETASNISVSQISRLGNRNLKTSRKSFAQLVQALFIRSMKRSSALYDAMEARCYKGKILVLNEHRPKSSYNIAVIVIFEGLLLACTVMTKVGLIDII